MPLNNNSVSIREADHTFPQHILAILLPQALKKVRVLRLITSYVQMPSSALNVMVKRDRDKRSSPGGHLNVPRVFRELWPVLEYSH